MKSPTKKPAHRTSLIRQRTIAALLAILTSATLRADAVLDWNAYATNAIVGMAAMRPERGLTRLAMVHLAIYDAVNAINGYAFEPYAVTPTVNAPASPEAATAAAAHDMLVALFPSQQGDLDNKYAAALAAIPDGPAKTNGISVGQQTAAGILTVRANDGRDAVVSYTPGSGPGVYQLTPPAYAPAAAPETALIRPFAMKSPSQFRPPPPPELKSETWARDFNETKTLGATTGSTRTPEQTDIARFWADHPILQWNRAWRNISVAQQLSLRDNARFFAMLTTASADAIIACWDGKYTYNFWRPVTAIRAADTDGNDKTAPDPNWLGVVVTPNHPEYPAAHGCFSGASTGILEAFFGTDRFNFTMDSNISGLTNPVRSYNSFSDALEEVLDARIYGGMHYRNSTRKGAKVGQQVADYVQHNYFQPSKTHAHHFKLSGAGRIHPDGSFEASGHASELGKWTNQGSLAFGAPNPDGSFPVSGNVVFTTAKGDTLSANIQGTFYPNTPGDPSTGGRADAVFQWSHGTGRFAEVSGPSPFTVNQNPDGSFRITANDSITF